MRNLSLFLLGAMSIVAIGCSNGGDQEDRSDNPKEGVTPSDLATDCHKFEDLNLPESANDSTYTLELIKSNEPDTGFVGLNIHHNDAISVNFMFTQTKEQILKAEKVEEGQDALEIDVKMGPDSGKPYVAHLLEKDIRGLVYESTDGDSLASTAEKFKLVFQVDTVPADAETEVESCTVIVDTIMHNPTIATEEDNSEEAAPTDEG